MKVRTDMNEYAVNTITPFDKKGPSVAWRVIAESMEDAMIAFRSVGSREVDSITLTTPGVIVAIPEESSDD